MIRLLLAFLALLLPACSTVKFYAGGIAGQLEILRHQRPILSVTNDLETPDKLRQRLRLTQDIRAYAGDVLGLPAVKVYDHYRDLKRAHVTWVVFAAPEFSTEPKRWFYPVLGSLEYRGFFNETDAKELVAQLKTQGFDAAMGGVDAYSTLGYLRDPLLNTFIMDPEPQLAELLFHELTHRKLFLSGDTEFNEAFATATAQAGVRRWLKSQDRTADLARYETTLSQQASFVNEVLKTKQELAKLYAQNLPATTMRQRKQQHMTALAQRIRALPELASQKGFVNWVNKPINNARLNAISAYESLSPAFTRLLEVECQGDFPTYFKKVAAMKSMTKAERRQRLGVN